MTTLEIVGIAIGICVAGILVIAGLIFLYAHTNKHIIIVAMLIPLIMLQGFIFDQMLQIRQGIKERRQQIPRIEEDMIRNRNPKNWSLDEKTVTSGATATTPVVLDLDRNHFCNIHTYYLFVCILNHFNLLAGPRFYFLPSHRSRKTIDL
jgi:hypothetical protein